MYQIALQMLFGERGKFIAMIIGLTFSALIMTQQPAIYAGVMARTQSYIYEVSPPDILWIMDPSVAYVEENKPMRDIELQRVRGIEGVEWAVPFYQELMVAKLPDGSRSILYLTGVDDATYIGLPPRVVEGKIEDLRRQDGIILDQYAATFLMRYKDENGQLRPVKVGDILEINDKRAVVVGIVKTEPTFTLSAMAFTTYTRAMYYGRPDRRRMSYIFAKPKSATQEHSIAEAIEQKLQLRAYTVDEFKQVNTDYWFYKTGIPINFAIAVVLGFMVGAAIAGQTFHNFVRENLKQFAVLKAMGVEDAVLKRMVLLDALVVGVVGYGLGVGLTSIIGIFLQNFSKLAFELSWLILIFTAVCISIIVGTSALLGIRTVIKLDPATVFRA